MELWRAWLPAGAPRNLWQPINPGWSFGNVTINEKNSSAPATEQAIVAQDSYGRQIGKLMDAVTALIERQPDAAGNPAYIELAALRARIDAVKQDAARARIDQLRHDLDTLRTTDETAYRETLAALAALLRDA